MYHAKSLNQPANRRQLKQMYFHYVFETRVAGIYQDQALGYGPVLKRINWTPSELQAYKVAKWLCDLVHMLWNARCIFSNLLGSSRMQRFLRIRLNLFHFCLCQWQCDWIYKNRFPISFSVLCFGIRKMYCKFCKRKFWVCEMLLVELLRCSEQSKKAGKRFFLSLGYDKIFRSRK